MHKEAVINNSSILAAEIAEWENLKQIAKNVNVLAHISSHIQTLQEQISRLNDQVQPQRIADSSKDVSQKKINFIPIDQFAWDQDEKHVNIYITLKGVQNVAEENIQAEFATNSLDLKILSLERKNYRMHISKLYANITPDTSKYRVKKDGINVRLVKSSWGNWEGLHFKESMKPKPPDNIDSTDPGASIMHLMKDLYQKGDDEMKRTIAKAWTEAQDKKHHVPSFGMDDKF